MLKIQEGTQIRFFVNTAEFSPADPATNWTQGTPTDVTLTLAGLASGAARQSAKVDLGADRHSIYQLLGCVDFTGETPTAGLTVDYYWLPSTSATEANGNVAGNSGQDAATPWGVVPSGLSVAEFARMGIQIGSLVLSDDGAVQNGYVGTLAPPTRWGQLLVINSSGDAFENDDVEMHQVLNPVVVTAA